MLLSDHKKRIKKNVYHLCIFTLPFLVMVLTGCAGVHHDQIPDPEAAFLAYCEKKVGQYENEGALKKALLYLRMVHELNPADASAPNKIAQMEKDIQRLAQSHFNMGMAAYEKGDLEGAKKAFLTALRYAPQHQKALGRLKKLTAQKGTTTYRVEKDDTYKHIARKVYQDPTKDFLIAYFMGRELTEPPEPGTDVQLPLLGHISASKPKIQKPAPIPVEQKLSRAKASLENKKYDAVLKGIESILSHNPKNKEALALKNAACYGLGKEMESKGRYYNALNWFTLVDSEYPDIKETISLVRTKMQYAADVYYRKGVRHFVDEDLQKAIQQWEKALEINPDHQKAKADIQKAKTLLKELNQLQ